MDWDAEKCMKEGRKERGDGLWMDGGECEGKYDDIDRRQRGTSDEGVRQKLHSGRESGGRICRGRDERANDIVPMERQDCFWSVLLSLSLSLYGRRHTVYF